MKNIKRISASGVCWTLGAVNNPGFNSIDFDGFKNQTGSNSFSLTPKRWIEATHAIGIVSKAVKIVHMTEPLNIQHPYWHT
jgi:hypothetical protein